MTIPAFQFWRLRVTSIESGDLLKIDSMAFLGRSGGDNIATGGTALSDAGDASGAFTGGSAWRVGFGSSITQKYAIARNYVDAGNLDNLIIRDADTNEIVESIWATDPTASNCIGVQYFNNSNKLAVLLSPTGASPPPVIRIYDTSNYSIIVTIEYPAGISWSSAFRISPDDRFLAFDKGVYNASTLEILFNPSSDVDVGGVNDIAFSPYGDYMAICWVFGGVNKIKVFNTSTWTAVTLTSETLTNYGFGSQVTGCDFSPDGQYLRILAAPLNGIYNNVVVTFDTSTWTEIDSFQLQDMLGDPDDATSGFRLRHSNSGQYIAMGKSGGVGGPTGSVWTLDVYDVSTSPATRVGPPDQIPGSEGAPVGTSGAPAWSHDDSEIVIPINNFSNNLEKLLYKIDAATWAYTAVANSIRQPYNAAEYASYLPPGTWIGYKFAYPVTPTHIDITASGDSRPRSGVIEYSPDGRTWYALQTIAFS